MMKTLVASLLAACALLWHGTALAGEIHDAAESGDLEKIKLLLQTSPDLVFSTNASGWTPLNLAAKKGHMQVAKLLLASRADVNAPDKDGNMPLHNAVKYHQLAMVEMLLTNQAAVDARDKWNDWTSLHIAAVYGYLEEAKLLLAHKADANARGKYNVTPLHLAAGRGGAAVVELLLANKAEVNAQADFPDKKGMTPLQMAIFGGQKEIAISLRQHGGHE